jgi:hypothetical protein
VAPPRDRGTSARRPLSPLQHGHHAPVRARVLLTISERLLGTGAVIELATMQVGHVEAALADVETPAAVTGARASPPFEEGSGTS